MTFTELIFKIPSPGFNPEILIAYLGEFGFDSFNEEDGFVYAYIPSKNFSETAFLDFLHDSFPQTQFTYKINEVKDENWNAIWESGFNEVVIKPNVCRIRAPFHDPDPSFQMEIVIEPKMAFGTAHHETTFMILQLILDLEMNEKIVLDMGSGTGILSILASKLGANKIFAIDNDDWAYSNAIENTKLNDIKNVDVILGDANSIPSINFDIIFANINRNILLKDMNQYTKHLKDRGLIIFSGYYEEDRDLIYNSASKLNLSRMRFLTKNNWISEIYQLNET